MSDIINQKIHEQIFGECWHDVEQVPNGLGGVFVCKKCRIPEHQLYLDRKIPNPNYCESIADAFRVVRKLQKDGWEIFSVTTIKGVSSAHFFKDLGHDARSENEDLPAKAICLAALKTLEGK